MSRGNTILVEEVAGTLSSYHCSPCSLKHRSEWWNLPHVNSTIEAKITERIFVCFNKQMF